MRSETHKRVLEQLHGADPRAMAKYLSTYLSTAVLSRQVSTCRKLIVLVPALQRTACMAAPSCALHAAAAPCCQDQVCGV